MTILLKKDGRLIIDADQPIEGVSLDNLAAILAGANDGDVIQYDATNGMWVSGAGGGSLPSVTSSDNGKVLGVVNAQWDTMAAPSSLPAVTASDKGKYLKANETTGDPEWASGGSSGGVLVVNVDENNTLDKTWQEIADVGFCVLKIISASGFSYNILVSVDHDNDGYHVTFFSGEDWLEFNASTANDYPVFRT